MGCCESIESDGNEDYYQRRSLSRAPIVQTRETHHVPARPRYERPIQRNDTIQQNVVRLPGPPQNRGQVQVKRKAPQRPPRSKTPNRQQSETPNQERSKLPIRHVLLQRHSTTETTAKVTQDWNVHERLAAVEHIDVLSARNIIELFEDEHTIPFICRYRQDMIKRNITPNKLRSIKISYTTIVELRRRAEGIIKDLEKVIQVDDEIRTQILGAKTIKDLEYLNSVYKPSPLSAKSLGIDTHAYRLLLGQSPEVQLVDVLNNRNPDLDTFDKVKFGLALVISELFSKHRGILDELRQLQIHHKILLKCSEAESENPKPQTEKDCLKQSKFETYFKFENEIRMVRPHQILAINRGEKMKCLNVTVILPESFKNAVKGYIYGQFMIGGIKYLLRNEIFDMAFEKCYNEKLCSLVSKQVRANLTEMGKHHALECFAQNLKQLLLKPPLKGERILGIDPGFRNGCKLAMVSETSDVLDVGVIFPHIKSNQETDQLKWGIKLGDFLRKHGCKTIALGDGQACRETETWLAKLFEKGILDRNKIRYDIVSEQGTSVYSCSDLAKSEFPKLDAKLISAVSIARRLIDPLSEYVKVEPRHLGIGMYQLDLNEKLLTKSLNEVVSECVSFVGVDINTASLSVLRYVAGLNHEKATSIIDYRQSNGPFRSRNELLRVKTIGKPTFVQCAGFIRIEPKSVGGKLQNLLDCTWVHPESYTVAIDIITQCNLDMGDIGNPHFISKIKSFVDSNGIGVLASRFEIPAERLAIVLNSLQRELLQDYRPDFERKVFKQDILTFDDLFIGQIVTGEVRNIVAYGAFVNIGLGVDALIHRTKMNGMKVNLGDRVSASVIDLDIGKRRVSLRLDEVI